MIQVTSLLWTLLVFNSIFQCYNLPRSKRALGHIYTTPWTNGSIPYFINPSFLEADIFYIKRAMDLYSNETCIRFEPYKPDLHPNWLKIEDSEICHSEIGLKNTGQQALFLARSCRSFGLILHELAHTIGLLHEMMRPDRNQFIRVFTENMQEDAVHGFAIESQHYKLLGTPFDFQSITMYSPYDFSKNGLPVWTKMNASDTTPIFDGREKDISFWDIKAINDLYQCSKHCPASECSSPKFVDKNCICQSPEEFADRRCIDDPNHLNICMNASLTDICYNKPIVASVICRKTCGKCFRYGSHGVSSPPKYNCVDHNVERCERNKYDGYCFTDTWTKVNCKKSCGKCVVQADPSVIEFVCKDRDNPDACEDWARNGQCEANPIFMKSHCALSCRSCESNTTLVKPEAPCRNYSPDKYCDAMSKENKCEGTTLKVCLGSCGKCGPNYERNEANITELEIERIHKNAIKKECKDLLTGCESFALLGHCKTHRESMQYHCNKSCNFCDDADCVNMDPNHVCDDVKERGLCKLHAGFANRCMKTCNLCKTVPHDEIIIPKCRDQESHHICKELVRRKQCRVDINRTRRCLRSCDLCNTSFATFTEEKPKIVSTTPSVVACVDEDSLEICERLTTNGWCQSYLDRAVLCRKSCNLCDVPNTTPSCIDVDPTETCKSWASAGYCKENREHMFSRCALSCNFCSATEESEIKASSCSNVDDDNVCDSYVQEKYCETASEFMKERCKMSCGFCNHVTSTTKVTIPTTTKICRDIESNETCKSWKERGFCEDYPDYLREHCAYTCNKCSSQENSETQTLTGVATTIVPCTNSETDDTCESWKGASYCNLDHIAALCKKTCARCPGA